MRARANPLSLFLLKGELSAVFIGLCVTVVPAVSIGAESSTGTTVSFEDRFAVPDGPPRGWRMDKGSFLIEDRMFRPATDGSHLSLVRDPDDHTKLLSLDDVEASYRVVGANETGFLLHYDPWNFVLCILANNALYWHRVVETRWSSPLSMVGVPALDYDNARFFVECKNDVATVTVTDGANKYASQLKLSDTDIYAGGVGFFTGGGAKRPRFDDLTVKYEASRDHTSPEKEEYLSDAAVEEAATKAAVLASEIKSTEDLISAARQLESKIGADRLRPRYHFLPPRGWMNDPNGAIFWKGRYHLFYQHNPKGAYHHRIQWGHASSADLVHWVHHPIALTPTPGGPDRDGCFSGGGAVVADGLPTLIYHGNPDGTCIATSSDDDLATWDKCPENPVISAGKVKGDFGVYDPCVWRDGDSWYALCGGAKSFLFKSSDLLHWEYLRPFYSIPNEDCVVPDFFTLGSKHVLLFASHHLGVQYTIGRFEGERFHPELRGRMNWAGGPLAAPVSMLDDKGRRVFFGWLFERRSAEAQRAAGWSGAMTLPRELSLAGDGTLLIKPVPELSVLRYNHRAKKDIVVNQDSYYALEEMGGDCVELRLRVAPGKTKAFGLKVRCTPDGAEQTAITWDFQRGVLKIDVSKSSLDKTIIYNANNHWTSPECKVQTAPFELEQGELLEATVFLDRSVLEVFANDRQCITQRIYPTRSDSLGVSLFSVGGNARVISIDAWDMHATH